MTVTITSSETAWQAGNGSNKNWNFNFPLPNATALIVQVANSGSPALDAWTEYTTNFEVVYTNADKTAGYVVYPSAGAAVVSGKYVRIRRNMPYTQTTDIGSEGRFDPQLHEDTFDREVMMIQQLKRDQGYLKLEYGTATASIAASVNGAIAAAQSSAAYANDSKLYAASANYSASVVVAAAASIGNIVFYDTYSAANAAVGGMVANQVVEIFADENYGGSRTRYRKEGAVLVHKLTFDNAREFNIIHYGAKPDGATDATAAIQAAITAARIVKGKVLVPAGVFKLALGSAALDVGLGDVSIVGVYGGSIIQWDEGDSSPVTDEKCAFKNVVRDSSKGYVNFEGITFRGTFGLGNNLRRGGCAVFLDHYKEVRFTQCRFMNCSQMATDLHFNKQVIFERCLFQDVSRDGARMRECFSGYVTGCVFRRVGDDNVAWHHGKYETDGYDPDDGSPRGEGLIAIGNFFYDGSNPFACVGGRKVIIANNFSDRGGGHGFAYVIAYTNEGSHPVGHVLVEGNIVMNGHHEDAVIYIRGEQSPRGSVSTGGVVPGMPKPDGSFEYIWNHQNVSVVDLADPFPPMENIIVANNIIGRTLPAVAHYTDWGFGKFSTDPSGSYDDDRAVTDAMMLPYAGINVDASHGVIVKGNIVRHTVTGIFLYAQQNMYPTIANAIVQGNIITDHSGPAIALAGYSGNEYVDALIDGNVIGGDIYRRDAGSNLDGTYDSGTSGPSAFNIGTSHGALITNNRISNVAYVAPDYLRCTFKNNIIVCDPVSVGNDAGNKGIRNIPAPAYGFTAVIAHCNPTDYTNYGKIKNAQKQAETAMPNTGTYIAGHFVEHRAPQNTWNQVDVLTGWWRATTGSGHVLNTDWIPIYRQTKKAAQFFTNWNAGTVAAGTMETTTFAAAGVVLGDFLTVAPQANLGGLVMTAHVSAADTIRLTVFNPTAGPLVFSATVFVRHWPKS